jgi:hypothetical protein
VGYPLVMLRNDPRAARGVRVTTALGSFGLTARGVRETPSVRSELSKWLIVVGWCGWFFGLSKRAVGPVCLYVVPSGSAAYHRRHPRLPQRQ